ncbi:hypothetical protein [Chitinophaga sp. sic0106]|uniref:hypothetical protein n=1 Tax=Chitinophaga sp. sic0106 TaxID=2854785 RepID=UPI001C4521CC|nr:hypothetical protein [Chitinophaga sp. sic0106]
MFNGRTDHPVRSPRFLAAPEVLVKPTYKPGSGGYNRGGGGGYGDQNASHRDNSPSFQEKPYFSDLIEK